MKLVLSILGGVCLGIIVWQGLVYTHRMEQQTVASITQDEWDEQNFCGHYGMDCLRGDQ